MKTEMRPNRDREGDIMKMLGVFFGVLASGVIIHADRAFQVQPLGTDREGSITLELPVVGKRFDHTVWRVARAAGMQVGLELAPEVPLAPREVSRLPPVQRRVLLSGMKPDDAFDALAKEVPQYVIERDGPIIGLAPRPESRAGDFLDTVIPVFDVSDVPLGDCLGAFLRLFDASVPQSPTGTVGPSLGVDSDDANARNGRLTAILASRISVHVERQTARAILNAICVRHGRLSWKVEHRTLDLDFAHATVSFVTPDGTRIHR